MITITNGRLTLTVSNSAYRTMFKSAGYYPLQDEESPIPSNDTFITEEEENNLDTSYDEENENLEDYEDDTAEEEEEEEIDLSEIPLGEMDFYQLCEYADQLGLDRKGIRSKRELRTLIKDNM